MVDEKPNARALEKCNAPAILMLIRATAAGGETGEAKDNVGWNVTVHSQQLAHGMSRSAVLMRERYHEIWGAPSVLAGAIVS